MDALHMSRFDHLNAMEQVFPAWPRITLELQYRLNDLTERLIGQNDEQVRGAIKELRALIDLPASLQDERKHLAAGLSDNLDPAQ